MRTKSIAAGVAVVAMSLGSAHAKGTFGTAKDAEALVAKAVARVKKVGATKAFAEMNANAPGWTDRDLYMLVYDLDGKCLVQGGNAKMVGKDLIDLRDADGRLFIKERVDLARSKGRFWQDYRWTDPVTRKVMPKSTYCERLDANVICVGIYKR